MGAAEHRLRCSPCTHGGRQHPRPQLLAAHTNHEVKAGAAMRRQGRSDLQMAALRGNALRDHLCWVWRVGEGSGDPALAEAAGLAAQVLRVLGVQTGSLGAMLCQVRADWLSQAPVRCGPEPTYRA